jgi:hypothetical protein
MISVRIKARQIESSFINHHVFFSSALWLIEMLGRIRNFQYLKTIGSEALFLYLKATAGQGLHKWIVTFREFFFGSKNIC